SHQPDLNFDNPRVVWAVVQVMRRWLDMGVDGFRLDAIPYLCEREGTTCDNLPETHAVIKQLRAELDAYSPDKVLLAEANLWPEDVNAYFADGDECHMAFHFPLMPRIYMAIAQEDRFPIADILRQTPDIPPNCQWALFLRNHDELTLEMVTDSERDYLWSAYAADPRARIYLGIRRRLAPLMQNDRRKIELMNSLLLSLPGTPIIYYGDEIGMGDNIYLGDRNGVRTPMQWTPDRNGGFSRADPAQLYAPVIMDPVYGYQAVNVEAQSRSISSLLSWMKRLIGVRKSTQVFGRGTLTFVRPANRAVLAYLRQYGEETILCVANLSRSAQAAELDLSQWRGRVPLEMLGRTEFPVIGNAPFVVTLAPYGFFWFLLTDRQGERATAYAPELATLIVKDGWRDLVAGRSRINFEREVLPVFLPSRHWFSDRGAFSARLGPAHVAIAGDPGFLWTLVDVEGEAGKTRYSLPLSVAWKSPAGPAPAPTSVISPVRSGAREGVLIDAATDTQFAQWLMGQLRAGATVAANGVTLRFVPGRLLEEMEESEPETLSAPTEQRNTTVFLNGRFALKFYRRLQPGIRAGVEIGRHLTEVAAFEHVPPYLGSIVWAEGDEEVTVALVQGFLRNQGDGWTLSMSYFDRVLEEAQLLAPDTPPEPAQHASVLLRVQHIGQRLAELHRALAANTDDPAFRPELFSAEDEAAWRRELLEAARRTLRRLRQGAGDMPESVRPSIAALLLREQEVLSRVATLSPAFPGGWNIRHHGDLHLAQILPIKDDVAFIGFEGRADRTPEERRRKGPAAIDIAGYVRSLDAAAAASLDRLVLRSPDEQARVVTVLNDLRLACVDAFLRGYQEHCGDAPLLPSDPQETAALIRFFVIERTFYDIGVHLAERSPMLPSAIDGLLRFLFPAEPADTVDAS
ncbi:MAG: putative maltokinase, partial [Variibacter sp.]|nr:putative maltokinase [Variibacter sp.]